MAETAALQTLGAPADRRDPLPTSSLKGGGVKAESQVRLPRRARFDALRQFV